jgi:hypothetical protein
MMVRTSIRRLPLVLVLVLATSCGDNSTPSSPTPTTMLSGIWVGTIAYSLGNVGLGTVTLSLSQARSDGTYTGTWSFEFPNAANNRQGSLTTSVPRELVLPGAGSVLDIEFALQPLSTPVCQEFPGIPPDYEVRLALRGSTMSGESLISECGQLYPGRVELTRR